MRSPCCVRQQSANSIPSGKLGWVYLDMSGSADTGLPLKCEHCGATTDKKGNEFQNTRSLGSHKSSCAKNPAVGVTKEKKAEAGDAGFVILKCEHCGATTDRNGAEFQNTRSLGSHKSSCAKNPAVGVTKEKKEAGDAGFVILKCEHCGAVTDRHGAEFQSTRSLGSHKSSCAKNPTVAEAKERSAEPGVSAGDAILKCEHCGAVTDKKGAEFQNTRSLGSHKSSCAKNPAVSATKEKKAEAGDVSFVVLKCDHCGAVTDRHGEEFQNARALGAHKSSCARNPAVAATARVGNADGAAVLKCEHCGATTDKKGNEFQNTRSLGSHKSSCAKNPAVAATKAKKAEATEATEVVAPVF